MKKSKINISFLFLFANGSDIAHLRLFHILLSFKFSFRKLSKIFSMENICLSRATNVNNVLFQEYFLENGTLHHLLKINIINTQESSKRFFFVFVFQNAVVYVFTQIVFLYHKPQNVRFYFSLIVMKYLLIKT